MNPLVQTLIASFFMRKGKPNKVLNKMGLDVLGSLLEGTFENGKPTMKTLETITQLNNSSNSKSRAATKAQKEAQEFLKQGGAKKEMHKWVMQDLISPLLSGTARTAGNTIAAQAMVPAMIANAVAQANQVNPLVAQSTAGGKLMAMAPAATAAALSGRGAVKSALSQGLGNTFGNAVDHAASVARIEDQAARQMQNIQAQAAAQNEPLRNSQWDYYTQQQRQLGKVAGGGM